MILNKTQNKLFTPQLDMMDFSNDFQDDMSPIGEFSDFEGYEVWGYYDQNQPKPTREAFERKLTLNSLYKKVHNQKLMQDKLNTTDSFQYRIEPLLDGNEHIITERRVNGRVPPKNLIDSVKSKRSEQMSQKRRPGFRRKSDVSSWSGGAVKLEAKTTFMTFSVRPENIFNTQNPSGLDSIKSPKNEKRKFQSTLEVTKRPSKPSASSRGYTTLAKIKSSNHLDRAVANGVSITLPGPETGAPSLTDQGQATQRAKPSDSATSINNIESSDPKANEHFSLTNEDEHNLEAVVEEETLGVQDQKQVQSAKLPPPERIKTTLNSARPVSQQWKPREFRILKNTRPAENVMMNKTSSSKFTSQPLDQKHLRLGSNNSGLRISTKFHATGEQRISQNYSKPKSLSNSTFREFQPSSAIGIRRVKEHAKTELKHWSSQAKIILHSQPNESDLATSTTFFQQPESPEIKEANSASRARFTKFKSIVVGTQSIVRIKNDLEKKTDSITPSKKTKTCKNKSQTNESYLCSSLT